MQRPPFSANRRKSIEARLPTVTVGPRDGMFCGDDHLAIQGAIEYVVRFGGGTVQLLPGHYRLRNSIFLADSVTLIGAGAETVLEKEASFTTGLAEDCDGCRWFVAVQDASHFKVGDGITLTSRNVDDMPGEQIVMHTICDIEGNRLYLDPLPGVAHWINCDAKATSIHSLIEVRNVHHAAIHDLCLAGNKSNNAELSGNYGAAIFLHGAENIEIQNVKIADFNGDAISWQFSHDVRVENCQIEDIAASGFHPGNGSLRPVMRNNTFRNCRHGIYWCWDVNHGLAEGNRIHECVEHGMAIGHRDTDNKIVRNLIEDCGKTGIYFRQERSPDRNAHRNLVAENIIKCPNDNEEARGIQVVRGVQDTMLRDNTIYLRGQRAENAVVVEEGAIGTVAENNRVVSEV